MSPEELLELAIHTYFSGDDDAGMGEDACTTLKISVATFLRMWTQQPRTLPPPVYRRIGRFERQVW
jgi:hypothetical protein